MSKRDWNESAKLLCRSDDTGLRFHVNDAAGRPIPFDAWGAVAIEADGRPGSVGPLLSLVEDGRLEPGPDQDLLVPHETAAGWDPRQVAQLGLPPSAPFRLSIKGQGLLTSPGFRFRFQLQGPTGVPVMGARRSGVLLTVGARQYSLLDPLFSLVEGMEAYNATPEADLDGRFTAWGRLQALLPEDAVVDRHLKSMNIVRADALTLDPRDGDQFDPVLLGRRHLSDDARERGEADTPDSLLPPAGQQSFRERFRALGRAQRRYSLSGNWFVMVPPALQEALGVVRELQDAPPARRRAFLANPQGELKERLGERFDPETIEALFQETPAFLSARVERLGEWSPKLHAFVSTGSTDWLPPEELGADRAAPGGKGRAPAPGARVGVPTAAGLVQVTAEEVPQVIEALRTARARGAATLDWQGQSIPTDPETEATFARVQAGGEAPAPPTPEVPIIADNLEELGFVAPPRPVTGTAGGLPAVLKSRLFSHQLAGLQWLQDHWAGGSRGALLADDMGLGKTVQTLAFLAWVREQVPSGGERKPHLIVAPTGLLRNWEAEADIHLASPGLGRLLRAYGKDLGEMARRSGHERRAFLRDRVDWVLTTYETLRDKIRLFLDLPWRVVVFDEAQKIKNPAARATDMAKSLDAELTLALTGTPVENSLSDLWCIVDAVQPGLLGAHSAFSRTYAQPAERDPDALAPLKVRLEGPQGRVPAVLLRRMKEDHLDGLPHKHLHREERLMPPEQAAAYDEVVAGVRARQGEKGSMLEALHGLRRVSLLPEEPGPEGITDRLVARSARLIALTEVLDRIAAAGEKALVFLEFLKLQEALIPYLRQRYRLPHDPARIYGGTPGPQRKKLVDRFQAAEPGRFDLLLLSPKAAGVGLTLTAANHVVHLSRWWNPAVEDQCTDRVYRIGQRRPVHVHLPLAVHPGHGEGSFDLNLHRLLEGKRALSRSVLAPAVATGGDLERLVAESL